MVGGFCLWRSSGSALRPKLSCSSTGCWYGLPRSLLSAFLCQSEVSSIFYPVQNPILFYCYSSLPKPQQAGELSDCCWETGL